MVYYGVNQPVEPPKPRRMTALVTGAVQGVGYRRFVQRRAQDLGLAGFAENLFDGKVEIVAEGQADALESLLHWVRRGPPHADVREVDVQYAETTGLVGFHIY
jgi:acylphosphatase